MFSTFSESYIVISRIRSASKVFKCFNNKSLLFLTSITLNEQLRSDPLCTLITEAVRQCVCVYVWCVCMCGVCVCVVCVCVCMGGRLFLYAVYLSCI